ncbi:MAG TPA: hypothetical protein DCL74_00390 [Succinivibrionaceae bacterium]|nr:hypothetical protein [Succinivibrionaceae bacterium]
MALLSILVPCYNVVRYVRQCLSSIQEQSFKDFEVIIIDDGSTDGTSAIIDEFVEKDRRFKLLRKKNTGYGDSMNRGMAKASGKYLGIVESDDWIEPQMYELLINKAEQFELDLVRGSYFFEKSSGADKRKNYRISGQVIEPATDKTPFFCEPAIWCCLYRRQRLIANDVHFLPTPGAAFQDTSFSFKSMLFSKKVMLIDTPVYHYRIHDSNSISSDCKNAFAVIAECEECFQAVKKARRLDEFSELLYLLQFYRYKWNFKRLNKQLAKEFMDKWSMEWKTRSKTYPLSLIKNLRKKIYAYLIINHKKMMMFYLKNFK